MSDNHDNMTSIGRRTVLKSMGGATGGALFGTRITAVASGKGVRNYVGVSYDTLSHKAHGRTTAHFEFDEEGGVSGHLDFPGLHVPIGTDSTIEPHFKQGTIPTYEVIKDDRKFLRDGDELVLTFERWGDQITGYATRDGHGHSKLGFTLGDSENGHSADAVRGALANSGNGIAPQGFDDAPPVPASGIPRNTALSNLDKELTGGNTDE